MPHPYNLSLFPALAADLLSRYGSPLYVYEADLVRRAFLEFTSAFIYRPVDFHYAIVCNKNPYLVKMLNDLGAGVHANTPGDAFAALAAGFAPQKILYSGTNLDANDFDYLLSHSIRLNLDSIDQVRALAARATHASFGVRLLIDDESVPNRIGITPAELPIALDIAATHGLNLTGLHMYAGTNTRKGPRFVECIDRLISASSRLPELEYIDIGGGFGIAYKDGEDSLDLEALGRDVAERMQAISNERHRPIRLIVEPGRSIVARAGTLLMTVVSVKERGGRRYIGVDSTVGNIVVESVYHSYHRIEALSNNGPVSDVPTDVCGNTTHSRDYLGRGCRLPELAPGDMLALRDVGAYGYAMSSHFLNRPRPAEVVLDGEAVHLTTRRESLSDLLATTVIR